MKLLPILLLTILPMSAAHAVTGQDFLKQCDNAFAKPDKDTDAQRTAAKLVEAGTCVGYIGGTVSGIAIMSALMKQQNVVTRNITCPPPGLTPRDMYNQVTELMRKDKDNDKKHVPVYVYEHFSKTYPCAEDAKK